MSEVIEIVSRDPFIVNARCAGCAREYRTAQPAIAVKRLKACQTCRPQRGNPKPSPFKGMSRAQRALSRKKPLSSLSRKKPLSRKKQR